MLNNVILAGRLVENPTVIDGKCNFIIAINRSFKNTDGIYETDFIDCIVFGNVAGNMTEYCKKGDIIGVRGRLQTKINENGIKEQYVIAERISFLQSTKKEPQYEE